MKPGSVKTVDRVSAAEVIKRLHEEDLLFLNRLIVERLKLISQARATTLMTSFTKPLPAYLPVETVIRDRQDDYYRVLAVADQQADATPFIEFMLGALRDAVREVVSTDHVGDQVIDQVAALIRAIGSGELGSNDLMQALGLSHRPTFRNNYLNPALEDEWIERTQPDSPRSPTQRYRLTGKGRRWLQHHADE